MVQHGNVIYLGRDQIAANQTAAEGGELSTRIRGEIFLHVVEYGDTKESGVLATLMELVEMYASAKRAEN